MHTRDEKLMVVNSVQPTDTLTFKSVESACDHLSSLCHEASRLTEEMRMPDHHLEFVPGLVVALAKQAMEVSTAVVCVFKKGQPHELQYLWTEPTMKERLHRMKIAHQEFLACNKDQEQFAQLMNSRPSKDPWKNIPSFELKEALNTKTRKSTGTPRLISDSPQTGRLSIGSSGTTAAIKELRNENSKLFAELQILRETNQRPISPKIAPEDYPGAELLSLRRRLQSVEKKASQERAKFEARVADLAEKEAQVAAREIAVAKMEWIRTMEQRKVSTIPPPPSARSETAPPPRSRTARRWR